MATVAEKRKTIRWEEYLSLPLTHYEIIDGEVKELPTSTFEHQRVVIRLIVKLEPQVEKNELGVLLTAPYDVVINRNPLRTRQPDLLFIHSEKVAAIRNLKDSPRLEVAPDLVVEIISPSETTQDIEAKLDDYRRIGVREVWLAYPNNQSVEVLVDDDGSWSRSEIYTGTTPIRSTLFPELSLCAHDIFLRR
jgi:Uma2 family endonuclease